MFGNISEFLSMNMGKYKKKKDRTPLPLIVITQENDITSGIKSHVH